MAKFDVKAAEELERKYDSSLQTRAGRARAHALRVSLLAGFCRLPLHHGRHRRARRLLAHGPTYLRCHSAHLHQLSGLRRRRARMKSRAWAWWQPATFRSGIGCSSLPASPARSTSASPGTVSTINLLGWHLTLPEQVMRQGNPATIDVVLRHRLHHRPARGRAPDARHHRADHHRPLHRLCRASGPICRCRSLRHPGINWAQYINNMYFPVGGHLRRHAVDRFDGRVPLRAVRRAGAAHGARPVLRRRRSRHRRALHGRAGQGQRGVVGVLRHHFRLVDRQHRVDRIARPFRT